MTTLPASSGRATVSAPQAAVRAATGSPASSADRPRKVSTRTTDDRAALVGSLVGSLGLVFVAYERVLPFSGIVGFFVCWYVTFLVLYVAVSALSQPRPLVWDRLATAVIHGGAALVVLAVPLASPADRLSRKQELEPAALARCALHQHITAMPAHDRAD